MKEQTANEATAVIVEYLENKEIGCQLSDEAMFFIRETIKTAISTTTSKEKGVGE